MIPDKKIVVAHVLHSFEIGGLENGVANLINNLNADRYRHVIFCIKRAGRQMSRLTNADVTIVELAKRDGRDWRTCLRLAKEFKRLKPHVVHTRNWGAIEGIIGARLSGVRAVLHSEHGWTISEIEGRNYKRRIARRVLAPLVDQFVAVSENIKVWLTTALGIDEKKVTLIPNGVDLRKFSGVYRNSAQRATYGFTDDDFVIGSVGRLDPVKDHESLLRGFADLSVEFPNVKLLLVGQGSCYERLAYLGRVLGISDRLHLLGERDDIPELLECMDVFVLSSLSEGMSNTILEAMAIGVPVIATRAGGNVFLVQDGENGFLVSKQDPQGLCEAIRRYLKDPLMARRHGAAGRRRVEQEWSLAKMVLAYDRLYTTLVSDRGS
jgi:sugar transferase (PEP-CTERM/EpsH1 system associated)